MPYMDLTGDDIRVEAMPAASRGATDEHLLIYLAEWEAEVTRRLGELPEDDVFLRGILRDLAASMGMTKIARTQEDYDAADELREEALERLGAYPHVSLSDSSGGVYSLGVESTFDGPIADAEYEAELAAEESA